MSYIIVEYYICLILQLLFYPLLFSKCSKCAIDLKS